MKYLKKFGTFLIPAALLFGFTVSDLHPLLKIGQEAPLADYKMKDISGGEVTLNQAKNENGLLVIFSCNTCPFVLAWENRYPGFANQCKDGKIGMIAVNSNEAKRDGADEGAPGDGLAGDGLEKDGENGDLRLTRRGRMLWDLVAERFLPASVGSARRALI